MRNKLNVVQDFPEAFLRRMTGLLGNDYDQFLASLYLPASTGLRVNTLKISAAEFLHRSTLKLTPVPWCPDGYLVEPRVDGDLLISPGKHPYHHAGLFYLQEPSAMAAAEALAPHPGEKVLDLAAAPGGKATHLAALMNNTGLLVANEIHPKRVWDLVENLERCGVTNAVVTNESPQNMANHIGEYFDRVLLDAPCSGEGMFRKSEVARREWKPDLARSCAIRQLAILEPAALMVKSGGKLAYTTCTYSPDENEGVIATFLALHPEFDLVPLPLVPGYQPAKPEWIGLLPEHTINRAIRIWPHLSQGEGHFIALLLKHESSPKYQHHDKTRSGSFAKRIKKSNDTHRARTILEDFCNANLTFTFEKSRLVMDGSYIYFLPEDSPNLDGLKIIHRGWWLGSFSKERFTPSHSLAMGLRSHQVRNRLPLKPGDQHLSAYFTGESFPDAGDNNWVLITVDGFPVGWGKRVQNVIKNYYPHGLRRLA
jgi:NOL1/NOP2/sun family putative RNA methylase